MSGQSSPWVVATSHATFEQDVIQRSEQVPVVLDFWSASCQPCRLLGPLLEKLVDEYQGKIALVKASTDQMPDVAASFGVTAVPTVFAIRQRQIIDQFVGLLSEGELRAWLEGLLPSEAESLAAEARRLEESDPQAAEAKYRAALSSAPNDVAARVGLARALLAQDRLEEARQQVDELAQAGTLDAEGERLRAELVIALDGRGAGDPAQCRAAVEASPGDLALQLTLAKSLAASGRYEEALDLCLGLIPKDRHGVGEQARQLMVRIFHLLGPESQLASDYRRKLTMVLY